MLCFTVHLQILTDILRCKNYKMLSLSLLWQYIKDFLQLAFNLLFFGNEFTNLPGINITKLLTFIMY
jgi:hypothetical protein